MLPRVYARGVLVLLCIIALGGFALQGLLWPPTARIAYDNANLLRLHVIANSDSPSDQNLKLAVRDAILPSLTQLTNVNDARAAEQMVRRNIDRLVTQARQVVEAAGKDYPVRVEVGDFHFPLKESPGATLPAGDYRAVRVVIGEGAGHNWWCVLFPPMCFAPQTQAAAQAQSAAGRQPVNAAKQVHLPVQVRLRYVPQLARYAGTIKMAQVWRSAVSRIIGSGAAEAHARQTPSH